MNSCLYKIRDWERALPAEIGGADSARPQPRTPQKLPKKRNFDSNKICLS